MSRATVDESEKMKRVVRPEKPESSSGGRGHQRVSQPGQHSVGQEEKDEGGQISDRQVGKGIWLSKSLK